MVQPGGAGGRLAGRSTGRDARTHGRQAGRQLRRAAWPDACAHTVLVRSWYLPSSLTRGWMACRAARPCQVLQSVHARAAHARAHGEGGARGQAGACGSRACVCPTCLRARAGAPRGQWLDREQRKGRGPEQQQEREQAREREQQQLRQQQQRCSLQSPPGARAAGTAARPSPCAGPGPRPPPQQAQQHQHQQQPLRAEAPPGRAPRAGPPPGRPLLLRTVCRPLGWFLGRGRCSG